MRRAIDFAHSLIREFLLVERKPYSEILSLLASRYQCLVIMNEFGQPDHRFPVDFACLGWLKSWITDQSKYSASVCTIPSVFAVCLSLPELDGVTPEPFSVKFYQSSHEKRESRGESTRQRKHINRYQEEITSSAITKHQKKVQERAEH